MNTESDKKDNTVNSSSDARVINNTMRQQYRVLTDEEKVEMDAIKELGQRLWERIHDMGVSRELSIAKTKTEEAIMWSIKHLTK